MKYLKNNIKLIRTEQWEWTASIEINKEVYSAVGSSENSAELHLLRKVLFGDASQQPKIVKF